MHENRLALAMPKLYAPSFFDVRLIPGRFAQAASWPDLTGKPRKEKPWLDGLPRHIFVGDMGDFLSERVTDEYLEKELLGAITSKQGQRHIWQLLTKRPRRLAALAEKWGGLPDNAIAMTTVTTQKTADVRIPELLKVRAKYRGLSCEPLLGPVDLSIGLRCSECLGTGYTWIDPYKEINNPGTKPCVRCIEKARAMGFERNAGDDCVRQTQFIHWVIAGGESGHGARPMVIDWADSLGAQCAAANVPFFMKQMGGAFKKGESMDDMPESIRVRQMATIR